MKRTQEDQLFGQEFARQLKPLFDLAIANGETEKTFAARLGVDRGGLQRYLREHSMPSLRTVVFAYRQFGIAIPYAGVPLLPLISKRTGRRAIRPELQMNLPLTIEAPEGEITVVVKRKTAQRYRLQVQVRKIS